MVADHEAIGLPVAVMTADTAIDAVMSAPWPGDRPVTDGGEAPDLEADPGGVAGTATYQPTVKVFDTAGPPAVEAPACSESRPAAVAV